MNTRKDVSIKLNEAMSPEDKAFFATFIQEAQPEAVEKNTPYEFSLGSITVDKHLYRDEENSELYYIDTQKVIGKGSFSKVRDLHSVNIAADGTLVFAETNKVARVQSDSNSPHTHETAEEDYMKAKTYDHLATQTPICHITTKKRSGSESSPAFILAITRKNSTEILPPQTEPKLTQSTGALLKRRDSWSPKVNNKNLSASSGKIKSITITAKKPGTHLNDAVHSFIEQAPNTQQMLDLCIIPLLKAYQNQVEKYGTVHCDLKPGNVLMDAPKELGSKPCTISFIDFDFSIKLGSADQKKGTMCYIPPEAFLKDAIVGTARDMFALGMLITGCFDPALFPENYLTNLWRAENNLNKQDKIDPNHLAARFEQLIQEHGSYNSTALLKAGEELELTGVEYDDLTGICGYFAQQDLAQNGDYQCDQYEKIHVLLTQMTSIDPENRKNITHWIQAFEAISQEIKLLQAPALTTSGSDDKSTTPTSSSASPTFFRSAENSPKPARSTTSVTPPSDGPSITPSTFN